MKQFIEDIQNICQLTIINKENKEIGNNIQELINNYLEPEELSKNENTIDKIKYDNKIISIKKSNKYIFFDLKRFKVIIDKNKKITSQKINTAIEINFNITFKVNNIDKTYKLSGIICHIGPTLIFGHYIYYKIIDKDNVTCFNDNIVSKVAYASVKSNIETECYILMYEQI